MDTFNFKLQYRENGEEKEKEINMQFLSSYILDQLNYLQAGIVDIEYNFDKISDIDTWLVSKNVDRKTKKKLKEEKKYLQKTILEYGKNGYLDKRFETIKQVLVDNGYKDDQQLMDKDFWYKQVDRVEMRRFIQYLLIFSIEGSKCQ